MKLVDKDGGLVVDILKDITPNNGVYTVALENFGEYKIVAEAIDDSLAINKDDEPGNKTGELGYSFTFKDKTLLQKYWENKPLFYSSTSIVFILIVGAAIFLFMKKRKKSAA